MTRSGTDQELAEALASTNAVEEWLKAEPALTADFAADRNAFSVYWRTAAGFLAKLPPASLRSTAEQAAAAAIQDRASAARNKFLEIHVNAIYDALTVRRSLFVRIEDLVVRVADLVPGLVPSAKDIAAEDGLRQRDKSGLEIDQGLLVSALLASAHCGAHLCQAMLLPRADSQAHLAEFVRTGLMSFPGASIERQGKAALITLANPRFLNAEDQTTLDGTEICVDLALLDPAVEVVVLRGAIVQHPKYQGRRVFGAGINLTHLYHGRIPFLWYLRRDLGYVNKIFRGLALADEPPPDEYGGRSIEKIFIAAVESFAIGGHCQLLLATDYVLAEHSAFLSLPARKEGIIPGAANMRLPRLVGDRMARQAILAERRIECASAEARLICDEIVEPGGMDAAIAQAVTRLTNSGVVSAAANRRALRVTQEPLDLFRNYFAVYAREQAYCHFSPALIANLERHWNAQNRKP